MFEKLKNFLLKRSVSAIVSKQKRNKKFHNLYNTKNAIVIFDATNESDYKKATSFVRYIQNKGLVVNSIGYVNEKIIPHYCMASVAYDFISILEVNFYNKPKSKIIDNILEDKYDMLIDLNIHEIEALNYISAVVNAEFKISIGEDDWDIFDFLLKVKDKRDLNTILKELIHYLENLGKNNL